MYKLTDQGRETVEHFIRECQAKRKEILDAGIDTADDTHIPTIEDIESDIAIFIDAYGEYDNCWGVTDNYSSDCLHLKMGVDFTEVK